jgi:hypothetical protein
MPSSTANETTNWLPEGKRAAVVFTIDDVHPASQQEHGYDAGGDGHDGVLGNLGWLLEQHPKLRATLFVPADWRETSPFPTRRLMARIPLLRHHLHQTRRLPKGTMRIDRHPHFVDCLNALPRTDFALHGLHHLGPGAAVTAEFSTKSRRQSRRALQSAMSILQKSGLAFVPGLCPPGWVASNALRSAMSDLGLNFLASARDVMTPISPRARTAMSGMLGAPLFQPSVIGPRKLIHFTSNFAANNPLERAYQIIDAGGLLAVKAHILKHYHGHTAVDGLDASYRDFLDHVFSHLHRRYGDGLWWTSMNTVAQRCLAGHASADPIESPERQRQRVG